MKWILLAGALLGAPAAALAQEAAAPARATVAVTHPADSAHAAYARLGQVLVAAGYDLEKASYDAEKAYYLLQPGLPLPGTSRQVGYLTTIYRNSPTRPELRVALQASVVLEPTGSTAIELRGTYTLDGLRLRPAANQGRPGTPAAEAWAELRRVAALLPGAPPTYRRER